MSRLTILILALAAVALFGQDEDARKARKAKLADIKKTLSSGQSADKIGAITELGAIFDDDARQLLIAQLNNPNEALRNAAAAALAKHRHPASVEAIGNLINANKKDSAAVKQLLPHLEQLDMCACLPILVSILEIDKYAITEDVLKVISRINCPEAAKDLMPLFKKAFNETQMSGGRNDKLANLSDKVSRALCAICAKSLIKYSEWEKFIKAGGANMKLNQICLCEETQKTFEVVQGKDKKCEHADAKPAHTCTFLKHKRESEMVGAPPKK